MMLHHPKAQHLLWARCFFQPCHIVLTDVISIITLGDKNNYLNSPLSTDGESEVKRDYVTCPR